MEDYTDYHRCSWSVVKPRMRPVLILLSRSPWYLAILTLIYFTYTIRFFKEMDTGARIFVFCLVTIIAFGLVIVFDRILNQIERSRGPQLIHYRINRQGIYINNHHYSHLSTIKLHYPSKAIEEKAIAALTYYRKNPKP